MQQDSENLTRLLATARVLKSYLFKLSGHLAWEHHKEVALDNEIKVLLNFFTEAHSWRQYVKHNGLKCQVAAEERVTKYFHPSVHRHFTYKERKNLN